MWVGDISGVKPYTKGGSLLAQAIESSRHLRKVVAPPGNGRCARQDTKIMVRRSVQFHIKGGDVYGPAIKSENSISRLRHTSSCVGRMSCTHYGLGFIGVIEQKQRMVEHLGPGSKAGEALS